MKTTLNETRTATLFEFALQSNRAAHIAYRCGDRLQFSHSLKNRIRIFQSVSGDRANNPAAFRDFLERVCCVA
jgi:hypothetical protein